MSPATCPACGGLVVIQSVTETEGYLRCGSCEFTWGHRSLTPDPEPVPSSHVEEPEPPQVRPTGMTCSGEGCDVRVDPTATGTYREVTGWEKVRDQGGANSITMREETGRLLCPSCASLLRSGVTPDQGTLL